MKTTFAFRGVAIALALMLVIGGLTACDEEKPADSSTPAGGNPDATPADGTPGMLTIEDPDACDACPVTGKTAGTAKAADGCGGCETVDAASDAGCGGCEAADAVVPDPAADAAGGCGDSCGDSCSEEKKKSCSDCTGCDGSEKKTATPQ